MQIVGKFTTTSDLIDDILIADNADDRAIALGTFLPSAALIGNTNYSLVTATLRDLDLTLSFAVDQNGTATITLLGTLTDGEAVEISFLGTVDAVNNPRRSP